jgi:hypothetical protein
MLWRKFKLDWYYAIDELFIVVAGVLVALAINPAIPDIASGFATSSA